MRTPVGARDVCGPPGAVRPAQQKKDGVLCRACLAGHTTVSVQQAVDQPRARRGSSNWQPPLRPAGGERWSPPRFVMSDLRLEHAFNRFWGQIHEIRWSAFPRDRT